MHIIAGSFKNRPISAPKGDLTRPTSSRLRESLFNICQTHVDGSVFLDLFAGSGAMGFEALSRGAKSSTFIDLSKESIKCIQANAKLLNVEGQSKILFGDVFDLLTRLVKSGVVFDIIYADPPYERMRSVNGFETSYSQSVLTFIDENISLLSPQGVLFLEDASGTIPKGEDLKHLSLKSCRKMGRSSLQHWIR